MSDTADYGGTFGSGLNFSSGEGSPMSGGPSFDGGAGNAPAAVAGPGADVPPTAAQPAQASPSFGASFLGGPKYNAPDPAISALDQSADMLQQRIKRANEISTNPLLQLFNPEGVQKARDFAPAAAEALQKIKTQQAGIIAGRQQAATLGLDPGETTDEATQADRVEAAKSRALRGDLRVFKGLQAVDPQTAGAIQDQVHEVVASHLTKAQLAYDSLSGMQNQGQYTAKLNQLRADGTLTDLEALGLKVPPTFDAFGKVKAAEGQALREARVGVETIRQKLEERNTYQPMETKEADTYKGRVTTAYGDQITNGQWGRNAASGVRGLVINGAADARDLGKNFTLATPEQRKEITEGAKAALPKEDLEKHRAFTRTYELATKDEKGKPIEPGKINTNPNVQQGVAEGLASMLRGGSGGANVGLLKIELAKRGWAQGAIDGLISNYAGAVNTLFDSAKKKDYQSVNTQRQIRDVMDVLKTYNDSAIGERIGSLAERAGALGLDRTAFGLSKNESGGAIDDAIERGRQAQIARMTPNHQPIGGGDGVLQLVAQRPGVNAINPPQGASDATTQLPGATPLQTPVQQSQNPQAPGPAPVPPPAGVGGTPSAPPVAGSPGPAGGGSPPVAPQPLTIAGQQVNAPPLPPGASPDYLRKTQRIETGNEKDPWKAGTPKSSAKGAFQFINSTWAADKPPGAPDSAADATPQQQADAAAARATKNAAALTKSGLPVNDTNLYITHNLGEGAGPKLLQADPDADARTVVGDKAASNNPLFFRGKPTVAKVLERYDTEMNSDPDVPKKPLPGSGGVRGDLREADGHPSFLQRVSRVFSQGIPGSGSDKDKAVAEVGNAAVEHAPAIGSTAGAILGSAGGPAGTIAGGGVGGGAGQSLKDYLQGREQSPKEIAKQTALGAVLGVASGTRPILATAGRVVGSGAVEGTAKAVEGADAGDVADATLKGAGAAAGGELFGRALGMAGHKVFNMFGTDSKAAVQSAAKTFSEAEATLAKEAPTIPGVAGGKATPNPKYEAAEKARTEAEQTLKDAGLKPEEAAYAHKVTSEGVPKQEAEAARPGAVAQKQIGAGYQQLESEVGAAGQGAPKASPKLPDGPRAAVESGTVSKKHAELAERTEAAITAPATSFQAKWVQLKDARSNLLEAERDAAASTVPGKSQTARDMRALADTVRVQQEKIAKYVFGEKDGAAFMERLKVLDVRYRNLMDATNHGDLAKAAAMKGEAGREAERKFVAFAHDDPQAVAAYRAMRGAKGDLAEATVPWTVAAEGLPVIGKVVKVAKLASILSEWSRERAAGSPVKFTDLVKLNAGNAEVGNSLRGAARDATERGAVMQ